MKSERLSFIRDRTLEALHVLGGDSSGEGLRVEVNKHLPATQWSVGRQELHLVLEALEDEGLVTSRRHHNGVRWSLNDDT